MSSYNYTDREGDRLRIQSVETGPNEGTYIVTNNGIGVYLPADEAPKAAQAILDAAGVKGVVLTDLPEVTFDGKYYNFGGGISWSSDFDVAFLKTKALRWTAAWKAAAKREAKAESEDAELKALEDLKAKIEAQKAHDELRTSPIALKALALYNRECIGYGPYESWDATNGGNGYPDLRVKEYIELAEQEEAKEKEAAERLAARRLDIYKELGGVFFSNFEPQSPIGYAIDRIIALEDK